MEADVSILFVVSVVASIRSCQVLLFLSKPSSFWKFLLFSVSWLYLKFDLYSRKRHFNGNVILCFLLTLFVLLFCFSIMCPGFQQEREGLEVDLELRILSFFYWKFSVLFVELEMGSLNTMRGRSFLIVFCIVLNLMARFAGANIVVIGKNVSLSFNDLEANFGKV